MASNVVSFKKITNVREAGSSTSFMAVMKETGKLMTVYVNKKELLKDLSEWQYFSVINANVNMTKTTIQLSGSAKARIEESPNKKRRLELVLNDEPTSSPCASNSITLKFWGSKIDQYKDVLCNSTKVSVKNISKDMFEAKSGRLYQSLNSTEETDVIPVAELEVEESIDIVAMNVENASACLLTNTGQQLLLSDDTDTEELWEKIPCHLTVTREGNRIQTYSFVQQVKPTNSSIMVFKKKKQQGRGLQFLAAQTLKIASMNGLGELDRLESELEEEINYDSRAPPSETIQKIRRKVEHVLHSKPVLLAVVVLNVIDCLLVLGELTFDFNHVGNLIKKTEEGQNHFIHALEKHYPDDIHGYSHTTIGKVYDKLLDAEILWHGFNHSLMCAVNLSTDANHTALSRHKRASGGGGGHEGGHSIEEELGHGFHLASVAILSLLVLLTALKVAATVPRFFKSKMQEELAKLFREEFDQDSFTGASEINRDCTQVFDAVVIIVSFIIDLVFIEGLMSIAISNLVIILTFLLPWRIIRILNSLIVAVLDKQRFQMKLLYKQKKKIDKQYQEAHEKNKHLLKQMDTLKGFCSEKGINAAEMKHVLGTAHQSKSGKMRALGKLALGPAESLSPRVLSKHISSSSGTPNGQPISFIEARKHSASTPNLPVIDETHVNVDDAVSKI